MLIINVAFQTDILDTARYQSRSAKLIDKPISALGHDTQIDSGTKVIEGHG